MIVGAGLAGLACARALSREGVAVILLEASDGVGGRVRTDRVDSGTGSYLIDRGFQVYLTSYPEGQRVLRLPDLRLGFFRPGALVRFEGRFWRAADPLRSPLAALTMLRSPLLCAGDFAALGLFDARLRLANEKSCWSAKEQTSEELLRTSGISERAIDRFFRPFFGGVFLDRSLRTSARKLRSTYRFFARGRAALPANGMQAISAQLACDLAPGCVRTCQSVCAVEPGLVRLESGETLEASRIVVATDAHAADKLVGCVTPRRWKSTVCLSYSAPTPPSREPVLYLDGDGRGPANHVAVISNVQPGYAPPGRALISASVIGPQALLDASPTLERLVRAQLCDWFGGEVEGWDHLRTDYIPRALPDEDAPSLAVPRRPIRTNRDGVYVAGDHLDNASINGALESGRRAAEAVLEDR